MEYYNQDYLIHYGVLGMKWGVRRYQNKDGSLIKSRSIKDPMSEDAIEAKNLKKKKLSQMSNSEIRKLTERQQLEQNYKRLNKGTLAKGMAVAGTILSVANTIININDKGGKTIEIGRKASEKVLDVLGDMVLKDINRRL